MFRTNPFRISPVVIRLFPKLAYQLVPAALVTTVGVLLLSNLDKTPNTAPDAKAIETPINAEAVFKITPRESAADAGEHTARREKAAPSHAAAKSAAIAQPRKSATEPATPRQTATLPPPLQIVQIPDTPPPAADHENVVVSKLRSATAAVQRIPQWAASSMTGWFTAATPPRPPSDVPAPPANFQAAM